MRRNTNRGGDDTGIAVKGFLVAWEQTIRVEIRGSLCPKCRLLSIRVPAGISRLALVQMYGLYESNINHMSNE